MRVATPSPLDAGRRHRIGLALRADSVSLWLGAALNFTSRRVTDASDSGKRRRDVTRRYRPWPYRSVLTRSCATPFGRLTAAVAFTGELIRYRDMQLDHIIPQSLQGDELHHLLEASGLDAEWRVHDLQNVVPSCAACNGSKRDRLANPRQIMLLTLTAKSRVATVKKLSDKFAREARGDKVRALIEYAMRGGEITREDLNNARQLAEASPIVRLATTVNFIDLTVSEVSQDDIERFRHEILANTYITMELLDRTRRTIATVAEYDDARANGGFPSTATDLRIEGFFKNARAILRAVAIAQPAEISFVEQPHAGVCDLDLLPASLLQHLGERDVGRPRGPLPYDRKLCALSKRLDRGS